MIFNLFKSKPTLKELIPKGFVDIHSHILPGIDDGAKNVKESLKLISEMRKMGFSKIIGTPHTYPGLYNNTNESIKNSYEAMLKNVKGNDLMEVDLYYASEYLVDKSLIRKMENKELICLKESYLLVETNFMALSDGFFEIIFELKLKGYKIILAHPERYLFIKNNNKLISKLKKVGCKFQLNLLSITGYYGKEVLKISEKLIKNNLIDFVGSDIHNINHIYQFGKKIKINNHQNLEIVFENQKDIFS